MCTKTTEGLRTILLLVSVHCVTEVESASLLVIQLLFSGAAQRNVLWNCAYRAVVGFSCSSCVASRTIMLVSQSVHHFGLNVHISVFFKIITDSQGPPCCYSSPEDKVHTNSREGLLWILCCWFFCVNCGLGERWGLISCLQSATSKLDAPKSYTVSKSSTVGVHFICV